MSKQQKEKGIAFKDASPALVSSVEAVIGDYKRHRLSVSRIYAAYNEVTGKNETPQTCSSCLRTRAQHLEKWYNDGKAETKVSSKKGQEPAKEPAKEPASEVDPNGLSAPADGVTRVPMDDGTFIDFTPNDGAKFENGVKGVVSNAADGKGVKAGTYRTADGYEIKVQVGNKATYAEVEDLAS